MQDQVQQLTEQLQRVEADRIDAVRDLEEKATWGDMIAGSTDRAEPLRAPLCMMRGIPLNARSHELQPDALLPGAPCCGPDEDAGSYGGEGSCWSCIDTTLAPATATFVSIQLLLLLLPPFTITRTP